MGSAHPITLFIGNQLCLGMEWLANSYCEADVTWLGETLSNARRELGSDHPTTIVSAAHLSFVLGSRGDTDNARTLE